LLAFLIKRRPKIRRKSKKERLVRERGGEREGGTGKRERERREREEREREREREREEKESKEKGQVHTQTHTERGGVRERVVEGG